MAIATPISLGLSWPRKLIATELGSGDRHLLSLWCSHKKWPNYSKKQAMQHHISQTLSTRDRLESEFWLWRSGVFGRQFAYGATLLRPKENEKQLGTLPETNSKFAPENRPFSPKGKEKVLQPSIFRGENVSFRGGNLYSLKLLFVPVHLVPFLKLFFRFSKFQVFIKFPSFDFLKLLFLNRLCD